MDQRRAPSSIGSRLIGAAGAAWGRAGKSGPEASQSGFIPEASTRRATNSAVSGVAKPLRGPTEWETKGQLHQQQKTRTGNRTTTGDQVIQDRSGSPTKKDALLLGVEERYRWSGREKLRRGGVDP